MEIFVWACRFASCTHPRTEISNMPHLRSSLSAIFHSWMKYSQNRIVRWHHFSDNNRKTGRSLTETRTLPYNPLCPAEMIMNLIMNAQPRTQYSQKALLVNCIFTLRVSSHGESWITDRPWSRRSLETKSSKHQIRWANMPMFSNIYSLFLRAQAPCRLQNWTNKLNTLIPAAEKHNWFF